jgi:hypothetical protein
LINNCIIRLATINTSESILIGILYLIDGQNHIRKEEEGDRISGSSLEKAFDDICSHQRKDSNCGESVCKRRA